MGQLQLDAAGLGVPDFFGVLLDGTVGTELAHASDVEDRLLGPGLLVLVFLRHLGLHVHVAAEVGAEHVRVVGEELFGDVLEQVRTVGAEEAGTDEVDNAAQVVVLLVEVARTVALGEQVGDFFDGEAEDEDVLVADFFLHFHVGAVKRTDGERAVEGELHVAGTRGFGARGRNLFGEVRGRDDLLGEGHAVVLEEHHLELALANRVGVDDGGDGVREADDLLGHPVTRSGLTTDHDGARHDFLAVLDLDVKMDGVEDVQELALVFVDALDLHIEERVGIDIDTLRCLEVLGEAFLVLLLDGHEFLLELGVLGELLELAQVVEVLDPAFADLGRDETRHGGVGLADPATRRHAVRLVVELFGPQFVEVLEERRLQEVAVEGGHAVHGERTHDGEVGHADHLAAAFLDEAHAGETGVVAGPLHADHAQEAGVDFVNDLEVTRQELFEQADGPLFEGFGHQGVVRVGERLGDDFPGVVPFHVFEVEEDAHHFGDGDCRVRIVQLDGDLLGEELPVVVVQLLEAADNILQRSGAEEVLLLEAQFLTVHGGVVRVQHLGDGLGEFHVLHGGDVVAVVEVAEAEVVGGLGAPEAQVVHGVVLVARNRGVVREGEHVVLRFPAVAELALVVHPAHHVAVERDLDGVRRTGDFPGVREAQPVVRLFFLFAVHDLLAEHTVFVADTHAGGREFERCHGVEEAGSQAAETAVAETRVDFLFAEFFERHADFVERFSNGAFDVEVQHGVAERTADKEFEGEVVDALDVFVVVGVLGLDPAVDEAVADGVSDGEELLVVGHGHLVTGERVVDVVGECLAERFRVGAEHFDFFCFLGCFCHDLAYGVYGLNQIRESRFYVKKCRKFAPECKRILIKAGVKGAKRGVLVLFLKD